MHRGTILAGRYRLVERIGSGGMSEIWRAYDEVLDRQVAVKPLLSTELARREAWASARIKHPDVVSVHDFVAGVLLVMELVEGVPLSQRLPVPGREAVRIGRRVAGVLAEAHRLGVVHRDVTPDNIMLAGDRVTVLDFGIAAWVGEPDEDSTGSSFGTPAYVAPERLDGTPAQTATDVYALGVVLFEMLTGRLPFPVQSWEDVAKDHGVVPLPSGAPRRIGRLVVRCLARDPAKRPSAAEVATVLAGSAGERLRVPWATRKMWLTVPLVALALLWPPSYVDEPMAEQPPVSAVDIVALIEQAEARGEIRPDVALDLRQVIRNGMPRDALLAKIATREREGAITPRTANDLRINVGLSHRN